MLDRLITTYRESVQPRMAALPIYNANLAIEAVGFARRAGRHSGVLITPWCMNLVLFPCSDDEWENAASGEAVEIDFPAGRYRCMVSMTDGIVPHLSLPLFTTVQELADQDMARRVALEILRRLYSGATGDTAAVAAEHVPEDRQTTRTLTRRQLLRGLQ